METGVDLPDHVIEDILLRLPVKHVLRFKCVSKHWYARIWDDNFVMKHYHFSYARYIAVHGDVPLLLDTPAIFSELTQFHLLLNDGVRDVVANLTPDFVRDIAAMVANESEISNTGLRFIGVVNGIACLQWDWSRLVLWNPATREIRKVPPWPITLDYETRKKFTKIDGFGFDLQSNDFKILGVITAFDGDKSYCKPVFNLYSLKSNSWKRVKDAPRTSVLFYCSSTDAYFNNGVYYWFAREWIDKRRRVGIVSFNFSSEIFKEFELPGVAQTWVGCSLSIGKYKEGLALLVTRRTLESKDKCFEIWAVNKFRDDDYEVPSSWQIVVKVPPVYAANGLRLGSFFDCGDLLLTIHRRENNDDEGDGHFAKAGAYVYRPSTCSFNYLGFGFGSNFKYVESLFPLSRRLDYIDTN